MNALVINCSPVRTGATAEIVRIVSEDYGHLEIEACGRLGLCFIEYKEDVEPRRQDIIEFCNRITERKRKKEQDADT